MVNIFKRFFLNRKISVLLFTLGYVLIANLWMLATEYLLPSETAHAHAVIFGLFFITVTAGLLYFLLHRWQGHILSNAELLKAIINTVPVRIFWKDKNLNYLGCNNAFANDAGEESPEVIIGKNDFQLSWKEQAAQYRADDLDVILSDRPKLSFEEPQTTPDGSMIWLNTSKIPLRNENNEIIGILGMYDDITARKQTERSLLNEKLSAQNYLDIVGVMILVLDNAKNVQMINRRGCEIIGYTADEVIGKNWIENFLPERFRNAVKDVGDSLIRPEKPHITYFENPVLTKTGEERLIAWRNTTLFDLEGNIIGILTSGEDITEQREAESALLQSTRHLQSIIENEPECVKLISPDGYLLDMNPAGLAMIEADTLAEAQQHPLTEFLLPEWQEKFMALHERVIKGESGKLEFEIVGLKGKHRWLETHSVPMRDAKGDIPLHLGITRDITERKQFEERIRYLANYDILTGLPNRVLLDEHFQHLIDHSKRNNTVFTVMFLDLDHFKEINDTLGHSYGDALLIEIAKRLRTALRAEDILARLGGDEFVILLPDTESHGAVQVVQKLLSEVIRPVNIHEHEFTVSASVGIALYPSDGSEMELLSKNADSAMYRAKEEGRNDYRFFTKKMQEHATRNLQLGNALRHAIERNELRLAYQPQISLKERRIIGAEALLRWRHPEFGEVSPAEFIPIAEENGLILKIGEWVIHHAVNQLKQWLNKGHEPIIMAVNLSAAQFRHVSLPELINTILTEAELPPEFLEVELTERITMHDPVHAITTMNQLHNRGIRMSIDDFGTGYSSLSYLKKFNVYKLKIDQSFVRDIATDDEDKAIVGAIINMASGLGMKTIAEGVETNAQLQYLFEQGCDEVQGYYFSKPLDPLAFEAFVESCQCDNALIPH